MAASEDRIEAHYERLLFRTRAEKAHAEAKLAAFEDLVRSLADGSLAFIHADHAAQALMQVLEEESKAPTEPRDNRSKCSNHSEIDWECGGCGLYLGSQPSPDFGNYPCVCGKKNRPRPVHPRSFNHPSQKRKKRIEEGK